MSPYEFTGLVDLYIKASKSDQLRRRVETVNITDLAEDDGSKGIPDTGDCSENTLYDSSKLSYIKAQIRSIRVLGDYQIYGFILRRKLGPLAVSTIPEQFKQGYDSYEDECKKLNHSEQGSFLRRTVLLRIQRCDSRVECPESAAAYPVSGGTEY